MVDGFDAPAFRLPPKTFVIHVEMLPILCEILNCLPTVVGVKQLVENAELRTTELLCFLPLLLEFLLMLQDWWFKIYGLLLIRRIPVEPILESRL